MSPYWRLQTFMIWFHFNLNLSREYRRNNEMKSDLLARLAASLTTRPPHLPPHLPFSVSLFLLQQNPNTLTMSHLHSTIINASLSVSVSLFPPTSNPYPNSNPNPNTPWLPPLTRSLFLSPPSQHLFVKPTTPPIPLSAFRVLTRSRSALPSFPRVRSSWVWIGEWAPCRARAESGRGFARVRLRLWNRRLKRILMPRLSWTWIWAIGATRFTLDPDSSINLTFSRSKLPVKFYSFSLLFVSFWFCMWIFLTLSSLILNNLLFASFVQNLIRFCKWVTKMFHIMCWIIIRFLRH